MTRQDNMDDSSYAVLVRLSIYCQPTPTTDQLKGYRKSRLRMMFTLFFKLFFTISATATVPVDATHLTVRLFSCSILFFKLSNEVNLSSACLMLLALTPLTILVQFGLAYNAHFFLIVNKNWKHMSFKWIFKHKKVNQLIQTSSRTSNPEHCVAHDRYPTDIQWNKSIMVSILLLTPYFSWVVIWAYAFY